VQTGYQCQPDISHNWGQYSPYFSIASDIPDTIPGNCSVTFVQMLSRHGARYPTSKKTTSYQAMFTQIKANVKNYTSSYAFVVNFNYTLGSDLLTPFGSQELVNAGTKFYGRYQNISNTLTPFVRASSSQRVIDSATNWTAGFHAAKSAGCPTCADPYPYNVVVLSEATGSNDTLDPSTCNNYETGANSNVGSNAQATFANTFTAPIQARLNANLPGANLTQAQTIYMMDMCPFVTVASPTGAISQFCSLFTTDEWADYNYYQSLGKWYSDGWGNPLGATQGVGFVNELIARLTATPVNDHTSTNTTLDGNPATFPIGGSAQFFADFSHDDPMTSIFSAFGFYTNTSTILPTTSIVTPAQAGGFSAGYAVPFSSRMYLEKQTCTSTNKCGKPISTDYVRVIINDRVIPLNYCGADAYGRCTVANFVASLGFATSQGMWSQC
jgi:hypothetical protein